MTTRRTTTTRSVRVGSALALFFVALACGADGKDAPYTPLPGENAVCPSTEEALFRTKSSLREGPLAQLGPHVERILVDDGGLRVLFPITLDLVHEVPVETVLGVVDGFDEGRGLARMIPHLIRVVDYIIGESEFVEGSHDAVMGVVHAMLGDQGQSCDVISTLGATHRLLTLRIPDENGDLVPFIEPFFDAVVALAEDETFGALLGGIEFDEDGAGGGIAVGRDAFILISRLLFENLAADNLDLDYVRALLDDIFVLQFPDDETGARGKLTRVLDLLEIVVDPSREIFPYAQALIRCTNEVDLDGDFPGMLYDYFSIPDLSLVAFLNDIDAMGADPAGTALRETLERALPILESTPSTTRDAVAVLNRFLADDVRADLLPMIKALRGTGVLSEVLAVVARFVDGCDDDDAAPPDGGIP